MKVKISKIKPMRLPENEVLTHDIILPYRSESVVMHPDGLFSPRIFGQVERCQCGDLKEPGYCEKCDTRVVDINNLPDYWFDMGVKILTYMPEWHKLGLDHIREENIKQVLEYTHFVYIDEFVNENGETDFNISVEEMPEVNEEFDYSKFNQENIFIGEEAALLLGAEQEWLDVNMSDTLLIPHPNYRPIIRGNDGKPIVTDLNQYYQEIIIRCNNVKQLLQFSTSKLHLLIAEYKVTQIYKTIIEALQDALQGSRFSIVRSEIIAHPISGATRGIQLSRHDVNEDVILIGDQFIETLYPFLYRKFRGDMVKINQEFIDKNYIIMLNRPPSISYFSICGFKPRVASLYPRNHMEGTEGGLLQNTKFIESGEYTPNNYFVAGDVESLNPEYIGRKDYGNVIEEFEVGKRPRKAKVTVNNPYDVIYPKAKLRMNDFGKFHQTELTAMDTKIADFYTQEDIEEYLYKYGVTDETSFIKTSEILDDMAEVRRELEAAKIELSQTAHGLTVRKIINALDSVYAGKAKLENVEKDLGFGKDQAVRVLSVAILESKVLDAKTFELREDNARLAYTLKKRDVEKLAKWAVFGLDTVNEYIAEKLNKVAKSTLQLTIDYRKKEDYVTGLWLSQTVKEILTDETTTPITVNMPIFTQRLAEELEKRFNAVDSYDHGATAREIIRLAEDRVNRNGENIKLFKPEMITERRNKLVTDTAEYVASLYNKEYIRLQLMLQQMDLRVRRTKDSTEWLPLLEYNKISMEELAERNRGVQDVAAQIQREIKERETKVRDLKHMKKFIIDEDITVYQLKKEETMERIFKIVEVRDNVIGYSNLRQIEFDIDNIEHEITKLYNKSKSTLASLDDFESKDVKGLWSINGKLEGQTSVKELIGMTRSGIVEKIAVDLVVCEGLRGHGFNAIALDGMAGDWDGDVTLLVALYGRQSMKEAEEMLISRRTINYANGTIRNSIVEDLFYCSDKPVQEVD